MAEIVHKKRIDDLAHSEGAEIEAEETLTFGLAGTTYEIDLGLDNADRLRKVLGEFIAVARPLTGKGRPPATKSRNGEAKAQRAWATRNGYHIKDRGRIPHEVVEAWRSRPEGS